MFNVHASVSWQYGNYQPASDPNAALDVSVRMMQGLVTDWSPTFRKIATKVLEPEVQKQFKREGRNFGPGWEELADATVKRRGSDHPILDETGEMRNSFTQGDSNQIEIITPDTMDWGSSLPRSLFHQTGTGGGYRSDLTAVPLKRLGVMLRGMFGGRSMPARPIIEMTDTLERKIKRQFTRDVWYEGKAAHFAMTDEDGAMGGGEEDLGGASEALGDLGEALGAI